MSHLLPLRREEPHVIGVLSEMIEIIKSRDCANSPKNLLVQSLAIAIEQRDKVGFLGCVSNEIIWSYPGRAIVKGVSDAAAQLPSLRTELPKRIEVEHAISHGRVGAANGNLHLPSGASFKFCHVIEFSSIKGERIAKITSFYEDHEPSGETK